MGQKTVVVSGINMVEGGIFTILHDCLQKLAAYSQNKPTRIYALVHDPSAFRFAGSDQITFIAFPKSKQYWAYRLYYEYVYFRRLSRKLRPDVWLSMHDVSPHVDCPNRYVYCHNPNIFYKPGTKDWLLEYKVGVFHYLYQFLFRKNIRKNKAVFVQQDWIRKAFEKLFSIDNVYVARPEMVALPEIESVTLDPGLTHFFYPSFSRTFKNFELLGEAVRLLPQAIQDKIRIHLTISADDNAYARQITAHYPPGVMQYLGRMPRKRVFGFYKKMDALLFPSKIETWGLPISEAKSFDKPVLLANKPYAKEAIGNYKNVAFFDADNPAELARLLTAFVNGNIRYDGNSLTFDTSREIPDWNALFDFILKD